MSSCCTGERTLRHASCCTSSFVKPLTTSLQSSECKRVHVCEGAMVLGYKPWKWEGSGARGSEGMKGVMFGGHKAPRESNGFLSIGFGCTLNPGTDGARLGWRRGSEGTKVQKTRDWEGAKAGSAQKRRAPLCPLIFSKIKTCKNDSQNVSVSLPLAM
jgi:hypothetical protein